METYRLNNIIILILLLLNVFLLILAGSRYYAQQCAERALITETTSFLSNHDTGIDPAFLRGSTSGVSYSCSRAPDEELSFAEALLGNITRQDNAGGGTHCYTSASGIATFRASGAVSVEYSAPALTLSSAKEFVRRYCPANYKLSGTTLSKDEDRLTLTAIPYLEGLPIYSAAIQFVFENNVLVSASGYFVPSSAVQTDSAEAITKCSAVIYLIDDCNEQGRICNTITEVSTGYILQSTASVPLLLAPVYRICTNTYNYYVNALTGHVTLIR